MGTGRLQLPFAVPFCGMTSYGLMGWNRALQKNKFSGSDFFCTCLDCFQSTQDLYVDRTGSFLRDVIVKGRRKETKKTTYWSYIGRPQRLRKTSPLRNSSSQSSGVKTDALTIVPQDPCLRGPSYSLSLSLWAGCKGLLSGWFWFTALASNV